MRYQIEPGEQEIIRLQAPDSSYTSLYPQVTIKDSSGADIVVLDLTHDVNGLYTYLWTASVPEGKYYTQGLFYTDAGHTTLADIIQPDSDSIDVCHYKFRPSFGSSQPNNTIIKELSDEDIERVVVKLLEKLIPEINNKEIKVSVDDRKIELIKKDIIGSIVKLENKIPKEIDYNKIIISINSNIDKNLLKLIKKIESLSNKEELKSLSNKINDVILLKANLLLIQDYLLKLINGKDNLDKVADIGNALKEINEMLISKDEIDDKRTKAVINAINNIKITSIENSELKGYLENFINIMSLKENEI